MGDVFLTPSVVGLLEQVGAGLPPDRSAAGQRAALAGAMAALGWASAGPSKHIFLLPGGASVHIFRPGEPGPGPLIVYLHGGSFVAGGADAHGGLAQALADRAKAIVALVDYRLLPEHDLSAAIEDALAGIRAAAGAWAIHGCDALRVTLLGDSAGGWLAARAALALAGSEIAIARLVLVNPMIGPRPARAESRAAFATGYLAATADFDAAWALAGASARVPGSLDADALALAGLPPTVVITNEADPVRDEGEAFAESLAAAGVAVLNIRARGVVHAAWLFPVVLPEARLLLDVIAGAAMP